MDFLTAMGGNVWSILSYALPFLFVLCVVVFFHELGHFLAGRMCGVTVKSFSVGFGPELIGFNDRYGTRWRFSLLPLGGYVKFKGDLNAASVPDNAAAATMSEEDKKDSFPHKPLSNRAFIVAAGPIANFILAIAILMAVGMVYGRTVIEPRVGAVVPGSAAEQAGFQVNDKLVSVNGKPVSAFEAIQRAVNANGGAELLVVVERNGQEVTLKAVPQMREIKTRLGVNRVWQIGLRSSDNPAHVKTEKLGPVQGLGYGIGETWFFAERTANYIGKLLIGRESPDQISGLPRIVQASGEMSRDAGFHGLLWLTAVMSVSIGLLNLMPIPLLDGGHLMFYAYESVRRKPLSEKKQEWGFRIGFALVISLMVYATWNDILHFVSLRNS
jgi:regulator of sigma E protease